MIFNLNLSFGPTWDNVSNIRNFVTDMLSAGIVDMNDAKKVATASSELVENVVKYSALGGAMIDITKDPGMGKISLTIKNIANNEHIEIFKTIFKTVVEGDPKEVYKTMMIRSFNDPNNSQLGLARIRYECQGTISYQVSNNIESILKLSSGTIDVQDDLKLLSVTVEMPVTVFNK